MSAFALLTLFFLFTCFFSPDIRHIIQDTWRELTWQPDIADCQEIGNTIVIALEQYKNDHGQYPDQLSLLVPHYLSNIPDHLVGDKKWEYELSSNKDAFTLTFCPCLYRSMPNYTYYSLPKKWVIVDF